MTSRVTAAGMPFSVAIMSVVRSCPNEKMIWPYAGGVVAVVAHDKMGLGSAIGEFIGKPMCPLAALGLIRAASNHEVPIAIGIPVASPNPAFSRLVDLRPEPLFEWESWADSTSTTTRERAEPSALLADTRRVDIEGRFASFAYNGEHYMSEYTP